MRHELAVAGRVKLPAGPTEVSAGAAGAEERLPSAGPCQVELGYHEFCPVFFFAVLPAKAPALGSMTSRTSHMKSPAMAEGTAHGR